MASPMASVAVVLAVMILPIITSVSRDIFMQTPRLQEEAAIGLGATKWEMIKLAVLPFGKSGVVSASMLGLGRALGETMAVQMLIGNTPQLITSLFSPTATLTSDIVVEMGNTPFGSVWGNALFLMAFVLLILSLAMILVIRRFGTRRV